MMWMKNIFFVTGKVVVTDSGFYVLKVIVGILAYEVYGTTVIKKKDIGPSTAREAPFIHDSETRKLGMFMPFVLIWADTNTRYIV